MTPHRRSVGVALPPAPAAKSACVARPVRTASFMLLKATALYVCFMMLWPALARPEAALFRGVCNITASGVYRGHIQIRYTPGAIGNRDADTVIHYRDLRQRIESAAGVQVSSQYYFFIPLAMVSALTLGTPISWGRRLRALALGLIIMGAVIVLGQMLVVYDELVSARVVRVSETWRTVLRTAVGVIKELPGSFFIPIIVYALATFRRRELVTLFGLPEEQA